jgi:hypothetical protein
MSEQIYVKPTISTTIEPRRTTTHTPAWIYPLRWHPSEARQGPANVPKIAPPAFTIRAALFRISRELRLIDAYCPIICSNLELINSQNPRFGQPEPADTAVEVNFLLEGLPVFISCETYPRVANNLAAIAAHMKAARVIARHRVIIAGSATYMARENPAAANALRRIRAGEP